ncbi:MAG: TonB C-terminal domain-containing protein [Longimicrobiales bacterium]
MSKEQAPRGKARAGGLGSGSLVTSLGVHGLALFALWGFEELKPAPTVYETIAVRLVSAPPATAPEPEDQPPAPEEELVVETPEEPEPEPEPEEEAPVIPEEVEPEPEPEVVPEETPPTEEAPPTETPPAPAEEAESRDEGGEDLNVRLEGLRRDYPAYYGNIIRQMRRCFQPTQRENLETTVRFLIHRDGRTSGFETVQSSGSFAFDVEAQGAVECAGGPNRIGPLPEDFPWDALPIEFTFRPRGG